MRHLAAVGVEGSFVALDKSGEVIGITTTSVPVDNLRVASTLYTGVHPAARGRGVASALKLRQVEWCRAAGYGAIETVNHEDNTPMLTINERIGFLPSCTILELAHDLRDQQVMRDER